MQLKDIKLSWQAPALTEAIHAIWQGRSDRYSLLRATLPPDLPQRWRAPGGNELHRGLGTHGRHRRGAGVRMVLAGGMGSRMGGMDKGLELLHGRALAWHCVERLRAQVGGAPGMIAINANRNTQTYEAWGCPVWGDALQGFAGPLAGFQTGLQRCANAEQVAHHRPALNYLLTVACDTPRFPLDLLQRLATALDLEKADIAVAAAPEQGPDGTMSVRTQPVFA